MIFIAGYHASGKTYMAGVLAEEFNCLHVETSAVVRSLWCDMAPQQDLHQWAANMESSYGNDFFDEIIAQTVKMRYNEAKETGAEIQDVIVTGNRSHEGIRYLDQRYDKVFNERPNVTVGVKAGFDMLWRRYRERDRRPGDAEISKEAFGLLTEGERRRGVEDIFDHADHVIINDKNREDFRREIIDFGEMELGLMRVNDVVNEWEIEARLRYR